MEASFYRHLPRWEWNHAFKQMLQKLFPSMIGQPWLLLPSLKTPLISCLGGEAEHWIQAHIPIFPFSNCTASLQGLFVCLVEQRYMFCI